MTIIINYEIVDGNYKCNRAFINFNFKDFDSRKLNQIKFFLKKEVNFFYFVLHLFTINERNSNRI